MSLDFRALWAQALPFHQYVEASTEHRGLWEGIHRIAIVPVWAQALDFTAAPRHLLVLAEDWCGDASNTIPVLAKVAEQVPGLELRVLRRDEHPEVMDRYLTNGARSIPIVIALDARFRGAGTLGSAPYGAAGVGDGKEGDRAEGGSLSANPEVVRAGSRRVHAPRGARRGYSVWLGRAGDDSVATSGVKSSPGLMKRSISTLYWRS